VDSVGAGGVVRIARRVARNRMISTVDTGAGTATRFPPVVGSAHPDELDLLNADYARLRL
jgi:hypothetical protein